MWLCPGIESWESGVRSQGAGMGSEEAGGCDGRRAADRSCEAGGWWRRKEQKGVGEDSRPLQLLDSFAGCRNSMEKAPCASNTASISANFSIREVS